MPTAKAVDNYRLSQFYNFMHTQNCRLSQVYNYIHTQSIKGYQRASSGAWELHRLLKCRLTSSQCGRFTGADIKNYFMYPSRYACFTELYLKPGSSVTATIYIYIYASLETGPVCVYIYIYIYMSMVRNA